MLGRFALKLVCLALKLLRKMDEEKSPKQSVQKPKGKKNWRQSDNVFLRFLGNVGYYLWVAALAIGGFIAWLISFLLI